MRRGQKALGTLAMFLLILALLITSFQLAIYGDPQYGFYEKEYEKYQVTRSLDMEMGDVMEVTDHMMAYLIGGRGGIVHCHPGGRDRSRISSMSRTASTWRM